MRTFEEYFSTSLIIEALCSLRLKKASIIHERRFFRKLMHLGEERPPSEFYQLFPPRRTWNRFRPKKHHRKHNDDIGDATLKRAIKWHEENDPETPWLERLRSKATQIREQALSENYAFSEPRVIPALKSGNDYRPIASFSNLSDKVIDIINARYLRDHLDPVFEECSVAFRPTRQPALNRISAIQKILELRRSSEITTLYVAECDIRGFFDCVNQSVAKSSLSAAILLLKIRRPQLSIDPRSLRIFESYLDCYSFSRTAKAKERELRDSTRNPRAIYKWPVGDATNGPFTLNYFYSNPRKAKLGIPQGGAHSCLIANLVLDLADKETSLALQGFSCRGIYLRYCDDMIIITDSEEACKAAFGAYLRALEFKKLPFHEPISQTEYGCDFFNLSKTKNPYPWRAQGRENPAFPWTQFLGYQIRYDGLLRVRPSSISKHKIKIKALKERIGADAAKKPLKVSRRRVLYRFSSKVTAFSVGRVNLHSQISGPLPMCWCSGFKQLHQNRFIKNQISSLDKEVQKHRVHLRQMLKQHEEGAQSNLENPQQKIFFGKPFSHVHQFTNLSSGHV